MLLEDDNIVHEIMTFDNNGFHKPNDLRKDYLVCNTSALAIILVIDHQ
jgi:hypothetical protein